MMTFLRIVLIALTAALIAGCDAFIPRDVDPGPSGGSIILDGNVPDSIRDRAPLASCGVERATTQDGPWNLDARRCFLVASGDGRSAEFASTRLSIEGDPVRMVFRVLGPVRSRSSSTPRGTSGARAVGRRTGVRASRRFQAPTRSPISG